MHGRIALHLHPRNLNATGANRGEPAITRPATVAGFMDGLQAATRLLGDGGTLVLDGTLSDQPTPRQVAEANRILATLRARGVVVHTKGKLDHGVVDAVRGERVSSVAPAPDYPAAVGLPTAGVSRPGADLEA